MAAAPILLDEIIEEFLLRLPPAEPETLVHAALVCKPWYCIISDPRFRRRFREFHRAAPMLGFFCNVLDSRFIPTSSFRLSDARRFDPRRFCFRFDAFDAYSSASVGPLAGAILCWRTEMQSKF